MSDTDDYEVGYKKPPIATRFGGTRSNTRARGRISRNLKTDLAEELAKTVTLKVNGTPVRMTQQQALIRSMIVSGMKGSDRATGKLLELALKLFGPGEDAGAAPPLSAEDKAILADFLKRGSDHDEA